MISDKSLTLAAQQAAMILNSSLSQDCSHTFSRHFLRKMDRILRRKKHPIFYHCIKSAAVLLLLITVCFGSVLAFSAEAREFVFGWVRERSGNFYYFHFSGEAESNCPTQYYPGWLPDGYVLDSVTESPGGKSYCYFDQDGWIATFIYSTNAEELELFIQCIDFEQKNVLINGSPGTLYLAPDDSNSSEMIWIDEASDTLFSLSAHVSEDIMIKIAENILAKK